MKTTLGDLDISLRIILKRVLITKVAGCGQNSAEIGK
jgi:hypothetical protein